MGVIELDARITRQLRWVMGGGMAVVAAISILTLIGWLFDVDRLTMLVSDAPRMAGNTAIALLLLCAALWLIRTPATSRRSHVASRALAGLAALLALSTLVEYLVGAETHVDDLFADQADPAYPGYMSPHTAAALLACALWLATIDAGPRVRRVGDLLAPLAGVAVLTALIGWLYGVDYIQGTGGRPGVAPQTVVCLVALFLATLAARPESPWMRLVAGPGSGGHLMRRFVPLIVGSGVIAGYVEIRGINSGLWDAAVGAAFVVAVAVTVLLAGLIKTSSELEFADDERRRLQESLVELADRDPLTSVFNRRRFDEELQRHFALFHRHGTPVGVLVLDLDDFKAVNDTYGHAAGDHLLLATADVLNEQLRTTDVIARFGGDEFVVLLPAVEAGDAAAVAEKLLRAFEEVEGGTADDRPLRLRASIGVAHTDRAGWPAPEALLVAADRALYLAKREGGSRAATDVELAARLA
jgi:diguanylate cyclase (GGDEF)-like protein